VDNLVLATKKFTMTIWAAPYFEPSRASIPSP
jgi:hypothetical protein